MDAKVHPAIAVLVIALAILAIVVWTWGSGQAKEIGGPAGLLTDPSGNLYIQMGNQLLEHDPDGLFLERHDLARLGVGNVIGAIGFFSNGDVLLRRGTDSRSLSDKVRAYLRHTNQNTLTPDVAETGLYRCSLGSTECTPFGSPPVDFKATFGLFIDWQADDVYVSDTTRHVLRKYAADGFPLAGPAGGFRFPNQLLLDDGQLLVADTNHHRIGVIDPATTKFGNELSSIDVVPAEARRAKRTWPSHLARIGDDFWVNNMRATMSEGAIYIFDSDWRFSRAVTLPAGADPVAVQPFNGEVLISDWDNDRVHRVSVAGHVLGDFRSPGLAALVGQAVGERRRYQALAWLGVGLFVLVVVVLLIKILTSTRQQSI